MFCHSSGRFPSDPRPLPPGKHNCCQLAFSKRSSMSPVMSLCVSCSRIRAGVPDPLKASRRCPSSRMYRDVTAVLSKRSLNPSPCYESLRTAAPDPLQDPNRRPSEPHRCRRLFLDRGILIFIGFTIAGGIFCAGAKLPHFTETQLSPSKRNFLSG